MALGYMDPENNNRKSDIEQTFARQEMQRYCDLIKIDPHNKDNFVAVERYAIQLGLYSQAIQVFENAIKLYSTDDFYYIKLANIYYNAGQDEKAIAAFETSLRVNPKNTESYQVLMKLYLRHNLFKKALERFSQEKDLCRKIYEEGLVDEKMTEEVLKAFCSVIEDKPNIDAFYAYILNLCAKSPSLYQHAMNSFRWVIGHNVDCDPAFKALYDVCIEIENYDIAEEEFYRTLKMIPTHEKAHYYLRLTFYRSQNYARAIKLFGELATIAPQQKDFHLSLAKSYLSLDKKDEAIETIKTALNYCGEDDELYAFLVQLYMDQKRYEHALNLVEKAKTKVSEPRALFHIQYQLYLKLHQPKKAISFYQEAIKEYPSDKNLYENIFEVCCEVGLYQYALGVAPNDETIVYALIALAVVDPKFEDLLGLYEEAVFNFPDNQKIYADMVEQCLIENKKSEAVFVIRRMLEKWPHQLELTKKAYDVCVVMNDNVSALYFYRMYTRDDRDLVFKNVYEIALAVKDYRLAVDLAGEFKEKYQKIIRYCEQDQKKYSLIYVLKKSLKKFADDVEFVNKLMDLYELTGDYSGAISMCEEMPVARRSPMLYVRWAEFLQKSKRNPEVVSILEQGIGFFDEDVPLHLKLCELSMELKPLVESLEICKNASKKFPDEGQFYLWLGDLYERSGEVDLSVKAFDAAIHLSPHFREIYDKLLHIYLDKGQDEQIISLCEKALLQFPEDLNLYLEMAQSYQRMQKYPKAVDAFRDALKASPGNRSCYTQLFEVYCVMGNLSDALRICPEDKDAFLKLYDLCRRENRLDIVIDTLKKAIRIFSMDFEMHEKLAVAYYNEKHFGRAEVIFEKMIDIDPLHKDTYTYLFRLRCQVGRYEEAVALFEGAVKRWPKDYLMLEQLAAVQYKLNHFDEAIECLEKLIKVNDQHKVAYYKLAALYQKSKKLSDANRIYRMAISEFSYDIELYLKRAAILESFEDYNEAIKVLKAGIFQNDRHIPLHTQLGAIYKKLGRYKECVQCYQEGIKLDEDNEQRYVDLGQIYVHFEKEIEALDLFKGIVTRWPKNRMAYKHLFEVYVERQKFDYAEEYFMSLVDRDRETPMNPNPLPYIYMFNLYYVQKKYLEAIDFMERFLKLFSKNVDFSIRLGAMYYKLGKPSEAIAYFQKALDINLYHKDIYRYLFIIYFKANRFPEAMTIYKKAVTLWPDDKESFAILYKICSKLELDEQVYQQVESVLLDYHDEKKHGAIVLAS